MTKWIVPVIWLLAVALGAALLYGWAWRSVSGTAARVTDSYWEAR